jgi:hypothetical protein
MSPVSFTPTVVTNPEGVQGSYPQRMTLGKEGEFAYTNDHSVFTGRNGAAAVIPFGVFVTGAGLATDPNNHNLTISSAATQNIVGLSIISNTFEGNTSSAYAPRAGFYPGNPIATDGRLGYPISQTVSYARKGSIWVYSATDVTPGDPVLFYLNDYSATLSNAFHGRFTKTPVATRTIRVDTGAEWVSRTSGPGLAVLDFDILAMTFTAST